MASLYSRPCPSGRSHPAPRFEAAPDLSALSWTDAAALLLPLPLILCANLADRGLPTLSARGDVKRGTYPPAAAFGFGPVDNGFGLVTWALLAAISLGTVVVGLLVAIAGGLLSGRSGTHGLPAYGAIIAAAGVVCCLVVWGRGRTQVARVLPLNPASAVHATALILALVLLASQLGAVLTVNTISLQARSGLSIGPLDLIVQEIPYLLAALFGVGLLVRRPGRETWARLGYDRPQVWHVLLAVAAAGVFFAASSGATLLAQRLTPGLEHQIEDLNQHLFAGISGPLGVAAIALAPGICEEALFRGALQPRFGILFTSVLFAAVHTQYGLSIDTVTVFLLACCLGLIRRYANTTTSTLCHATYNGLAASALPGPLLLPGILVEALLVAAALGAFVFTTRLGVRAAES
ncbi:MAG: CPBP family intramembrane metalloprotease [Candidatus Dormibacteraeota bacterium]|nr:CPBP family intramembrane metalloprotease [Candidatus Dormibacteraeota bacterium]MDQ6901149.1 CPBP family intramembrane metalloprotease [Candidatus Dormibacteraeota bacterium]